MSEATSTPNRRRARNHDSGISPPADEAEPRKRRAFLQTMGQQLRDFGADGASPQDHSRTMFGASPRHNACPGSRSTTTANNFRMGQNVDTPESDAAPGEDDQLPVGAAKSASKWLWRITEVSSVVPTGIPTVIFFDDLLDWSQSYFDHWHPAFPFIHAPSIIDYFRRIAQNGAASTGSSTSHHLQHVIVRSIMSISVADRRQMNAPFKALPSTLVFHSFNDAINSIHMVLMEESSILSLQALMSVQLFLITMHRYNAASRLEGLAVRMVFQLGLHRCPNRNSTLPEKEAELRKRLFWSMYCIDRYICIRLGTPLGIRSDEMDVCFPHDEQHDKGPRENSGHDDRLNLLEFLARHARIRGSIMENRNKVTMREDYNEADRVLEVEAEHARWWNNVDEYLSGEEESQSITKLHQVTLIVLRFESILALHRSVLATSRKNAAYQAALQRCISASRSIINTLHKAIKGFGAFDGSPGQRGYESTPLVWSSFTWAAWMSCFIIVFAATEGQVAREVALRLSDRSIAIMQHLALRGTNWPEACIVAVQNLTARLRDDPSRDPVITGTSSAAVIRDNTGPQSRRPSLPHQTNHAFLDQNRSGRATPRLSSAIPPANSRANCNFTSLRSQNIISGTSLDGFNIPFQNFNAPTAPVPSGTYLAGTGNFLGIAQQSSDNPLPIEDIVNLFSGEDISFWLGENAGYDGQYLYQNGSVH